MSSVATSMILSMLRLTTPILIAASGSMFCEKAGIQNLGLEGMMLMGAWAAMFGSYCTGSAWIGVLCGIIAGGILALIHGIISIEWGGIQNISGLGITTLATGLTAYFMRSIFGGSISDQVFSIQTTSIFSGISQFLTQLSPITYFAFLVIPLLWYVLYKTPTGLRITAVGDNPEALETAGVNVWRLRLCCVAFSGLMAGLAGAYLSVGQLNRFVENMVAGRGMLAVIAVKMGKWNPLGVLVASLLFGICDAIQLQLQISPSAFFNLPTEIIQMFPLIAGFVALALSSGDTASPRAFAKPYMRKKG